ncbi:MAG: hypothetical protein DRI97_11075 [Bacteroidetes bacterium]|nr:MAG: hypothetical protein DRQ42_02150 [Gammaproteobacteria bacterium]RLD54675.1 MAG: hypothetical protein DRI97_11075 [Bacteroidota bacterium]
MARITHLPQSYKIKSGKSMSMLKGKFEDKQLYSWDAVPDCTDNLCPAFRYCEFSLTKQREHKEEEGLDSGNGTRAVGNKCYTQLTYVRDVLGLITGAIKDLDEVMLFKIGSHLVPLYSMWCRLKIAELGVDSVTYETSRGTMCIHPIYKEMRDTALKIEIMWEKIGLLSIRNANPDLGDLRDGIPEPNLHRGSSTFYKRMMNSKQKVSTDIVQEPKGT